MNRPRIALVVAAARNGVIGRDGGLPWRLPSDLKRFKALTMGKPVVMGRKTWESLPIKPLPGRRNIVVTRQSGFAAPGAETAPSLDAAIDLAGACEEIAVIGGGEIYRAAFPLANRIYLTEVAMDAKGDTFFPPVPAGEWTEAAREAVPQGERDTAPFAVRILDRRQK
jgi:dihydrofolate reductase